MIRQSTFLCRNCVQPLLRPAKRLISRFPEAYEICKEFSISKENMVEVVNRLTKEIELGLGKATHAGSTVKCFISYVQDLPTGNERGKYLALDLGGTNFRCLLINLKDDSEIETELKTFAVSKAMMKGSGRNLFHFIAECLAGFCKEQGIENVNLSLGFTFSFPLQQINIKKGILKTWTKGFQCEGVVGQDVVELLQKEIDRRGDIHVNVVAIINDSTGTLVSCARSHPDCRIGLIVGTGVNACYMEKTSNTEMFEGYQTSDKPNMIVNTELGAFGDNGSLDFIRTIYDKAIDLQSINPQKQTFEKCTSGMFLGEVVRHIVVHLMRMGVLFQGQVSEYITQQWIFSTRFLSEIVADPPGLYHNTRLILDQLGIRSDNEQDLACLRYVCDSITMRSAQLCSCALVTLIKKMNVEECTVGIDGGLCRYHPHYLNMLAEQMSPLLKDSSKIKLVLSEDGSGLGAALVAATRIK